MNQQFTEKVTFPLGLERRAKFAAELGTGGKGAVRS